MSEFLVIFTNTTAVQKILLFTYHYTSNKLGWHRNSGFILLVIYWRLYFGFSKGPDHVELGVVLFMWNRVELSQVRYVCSDNIFILLHSKKNMVKVGTKDNYSSCHTSSQFNKLHPRFCWECSVNCLHRYFLNTNIDRG